MRLLRALYLTAGRTQELLDVLDIIDPRTIRRLFDRAGIPHGKSHSVLMPEAFVVQQRLVTDLAAIQSCQNDVNNLAWALCDGQGTVAPFYIYYAIRRYPGAVKIGEEYIAWQCIDGQPSYWDGEGQL